MSEAESVPWYRVPFLWIRKIYDWTQSWADSPYGVPALFVLAFLEASFFPIPPDVLLMALALARPKRAFLYALVCTLGSVSGAFLGYYIGTGLWATLGVAAECPQYGGGEMLFDIIPGFSCEKFATVAELYENNAWMALFTAAFTPIPYKIFTIAAGVFKIDLVTLVVASFCGRGARFFLVGGLIFAFGPKIKDFLEKRFEVMTIVFTILLVGGVALIKFLH